MWPVTPTRKATCSRKNAAMPTPTRIANDVVAIRVGVGIAAFFLEHVAFRVGVTGHIEPVPAPTLAVARRTEQSVHDPGKRFRRIVREKIFCLLWRRRQAG